MSFLNQIDKKIGNLKYMSLDKAVFMRDFLRKNNCKDLLEIGFYKGKSSAYFAAILEEMGDGHLTTIDRKSSMNYSPNILDVLSDVGLAHRVTPIFSERSHTWEMSKLIRENPRLLFDFCYFDGGHTWDVTGFGFVLVNMLLRPGGWIIFDDLDWTITNSLKRSPERSASYKNYSEDEKSTPCVRMVYEKIVPSFGYTDFQEVSEYSWGIARKPFVTA